MKEALADSLAASAVFEGLPAGLLEQAQFAFISGLTCAALVSALIAVVLAVLSLVFLQHVGVLGSAELAKQPVKAEKHDSGHFKP